jgi:hypothetical protein
LLLDGLKNALSSAWTWFKDWVKNGANAVVDAVVGEKDVLKKVEKAGGVGKFIQGEDINQDIRANDAASSRGIDTHHGTMDERRAAIEDPSERLAQAQKELARAGERASGESKYIRSTRAQMKKDASWILPDAWDASQTSGEDVIRGARKKRDQFRAQEEKLAIEVAALQKQQIEHFLQTADPKDPMAVKAQKTLEKLNKASAVRKSIKGDKMGFMRFGEQALADNDAQMAYGEISEGLKKSAAAKKKKEEEAAKKKKGVAPEGKGAFDKRQGKDAMNEGLAKSLKTVNPEKKVADQANKQMVTPGSIYTHDQHCEVVLWKILAALGGNTKGARTHVDGGAGANGGLGGAGGAGGKGLLAWMFGGGAGGAGGAGGKGGMSKALLSWFGIGGTGQGGAGGAGGVGVGSGIGGPGGAGSPQHMAMLEAERIRIQKTAALAKMLATANGGAGGAGGAGGFYSEGSEITHRGTKYKIINGQLVPIPGGAGGVGMGGAAGAAGALSALGMGIGGPGGAGGPGGKSIVSIMIDLFTVMAKDIRAIRESVTMTGVGAFATGQSREAMSSVMDNFVKEHSSSKTGETSDSASSENMLSKVVSFIAEKGRQLFGMGSSLSSSEESRRMESLTSNMANTLNTGAFNASNVHDARRESTAEYMSRLGSSSTSILGVGSNLSSSEQSRRSDSSTSNMVNALNTGAFNASNVHDAKRESVAEYMARVTGSSSSSTGSQNSVNELNRIATQLNGDSTSSDSQRSIETSLARTMDWLESAGDAGSATSSSLDYSEQTRGMVNTLLTNRAQIESDIERRRVGDSAGSSIVPGLDAMASYLIGSQADRLQQMAEILVAIESNTRGGGNNSPDVIGSNGKRQRHVQHGGVDMNVLSQVPSRWELTYNDAQPGDVTSDGNGSYG